MTFLAALAKTQDKAGKCRDHLGSAGLSSPSVGRLAGSELDHLACPAVYARKVDIMPELEIPIMSEKYKRRILKALGVHEKEPADAKRIILRQFIREAIAERLFRYETKPAPEDKAIRSHKNAMPYSPTDDGATSSLEVSK